MADDGDSGLVSEKQLKAPGDSGVIEEETLSLRAVGKRSCFSSVLAVFGAKRSLKESLERSGDPVGTTGEENKSSSLATSGAAEVDSFSGRGKKEFRSAAETSSPTCSADVEGSVAAWFNELELPFWVAVWLVSVMSELWIVSEL